MKKLTFFAQINLELFQKERERESIIVVHCNLEPALHSTVQRTNAHRHKQITFSVNLV